MTKGIVQGRLGFKYNPRTAFTILVKILSTVISKIIHAISNVSPYDVKKQFTKSAKIIYLFFNPT